MIRATVWAVRGEETAPVRVTRRKIAPVVIRAASSQARSARTGAGAGRLGVDEQQLVAVGLLVGLGARNPDMLAVGGGGEVLDRQGDELGAPEPDGEAQEEERAVAQPAAGGSVDPVDDLEQRIAQQRGLLVRHGAMDAGDALHDGEHERV
jgi:hypothetical protein